MWSITSMTSYNLMVEPTLKYAGNISYPKKMLVKKRRNISIFLKPLSYTYIKTAWWLQPIWKLFVKMGSSSPRIRGENKQYLKFHQIENIHPVMKPTVMSPSTPKKRCLQLFSTLLTAQGDHLQRHSWVDFTVDDDVCFRWSFFYGFYKFIVFLVAFNVSAKFQFFQKFFILFNSNFMKNCWKKWSFGVQSDLVSANSSSCSAESLHMGHPI